MNKQYLFTIALAAGPFVLSGCLRQDPTSTVDRGNHAMVVDLGQGTTSHRSHAPAATPVQHSGARSGPVGAGETTIILGADESLYQVAERRGISLRWLIERNDFTRRPGPGDRVIVPMQR